MANKAIWGTTTGPTTVMSTELNSLANTGNVTSTSSYDNSTTRDMFADFEFLINGVVAGGLNNTQRSITFDMFSSVDGTNFAALEITWIGLGVTTGNGVAQRVYLRNLMIPPTLLKFRIWNFVGQAFTASGHTVKILTYSYNLNG